MGWAKEDIGWIGWNEQLVSSAARTTSGNSGVITGYGPAVSLRVQLNVTAASGTTPTLNVIVEDTFDGTTFNQIGAFAQKTTVSREVINITTPFTDRIRVTWTIAGTTPSFTFVVDCNTTSTVSGG
jgi:hypothetical protein